MAKNFGFFSLQIVPDYYTCRSINLCPRDGARKDSKTMQDVHQKSLYLPQFASLASICHWLGIIFLLALSVWGLIWGAVQEGEYGSAVRLSQSTVSLAQDSSNPNRWMGVLKLNNQLGGEVQDIKIHVGCRCTVLSESPRSIMNGGEAEIKVKVEGSQSSRQYVALDFRLVRKDVSIPVSEVIALEGDLTIDSTNGEK